MYVSGLCKCFIDSKIREAVVESGSLGPNKSITDYTTNKITLYTTPYVEIEDVCIGFLQVNL